MNLKVLLVVVSFGLLYLIQLPFLLRKGYRWDLIVFTAALSLPFAISLMMVLGVGLPFVSTEIAKVFKTLLGPIGGK